MRTSVFVISNHVKYQVYTLHTAYSQASTWSLDIQPAYLPQYLPLHFVPITRILGWKGCPPRYLSSLSRHPFLWLEWGNLGHWEKTSMLKIPSFPKYRHILNNRTLRCLASKAGKGKELLVPRMTAETWYTYQTTTTNISLWSVKNCRQINNLVER